MLADNGGAVPTIAIRIGGIAQNAGDGAAAVYDDDHDTVTPDVAHPTDARGFARDVDARRRRRIRAAGRPDFVVTTLEDELEFDPNATLADFGGAGDSRCARRWCSPAGSDLGDTITFAGALTGGPRSASTTVRCVRRATS